MVYREVGGRPLVTGLDPLNNEDDGGSWCYLREELPDPGHQGDDEEGGEEGDRAIAVISITNCLPVLAPTLYRI